MDGIRVVTVWIVGTAARCLFSPLAFDSFVTKGRVVINRVQFEGEVGVDGHCEVHVTPFLELGDDQSVLARRR